MALVELTLVAATIGLLATPYPALALLPGTAAAAGVWMTRYPVIALYAIVFLIPFGAMRKLGALNLPWLLAGFLIALLLVHLAMRRPPPNGRSSTLWLLLGAYFCVNLIATSLSPYPDTARYQLFLIISAYIFVVLVLFFLSETGYRQALPRVIVWSVSLGALLSIAGYALGVDAFSDAGYGGPRDRFVGGAIDPNNQAMMIVFALPLVVHIALFSPRPGVRLAMAGLGFLNLLALGLTLSRSGFLMVILMALALLIHYRRLIHPRRLGVMIAGAAVAGAVLLTAVPSRFLERQESLAEWDDRSLLRRTSYLVVGWEAFRDRPIIGSGPGTFHHFYAQSDVTRLFSALESRRKRRAHNTYLEVLVGSGLLGFGLYMGVLAWVWRDFRRAERSLADHGDAAAADLTACYRIAFGVLLVFLLMLSDMFHKYMLLSVALSQVAVSIAGRPGSRRDER